MKNTNNNVNTKITKIIDGNEAAAYVAYKVTEFSAIYPITPSTSMGELADAWSAKGVKNIWGNVPQVIEMQSEAGAAGTLHGALQAGLLATTYTASQGLLLMIPNMYKIAGELTAAVIHVASRAIATQGLSIFGDHSDIYAVRDIGFALLAAGSVQEAHDFALIAHAATLKARIPFLHFFDGFRVSHEINKISVISDNDMRAMIDEDLVMAHRLRALNPDHPFIRGTAQDSEEHFQARETASPFYARIPSIVREYQERFAKLTGREYHLVQYHGAPDAERVVVIMGCGAKTVANVVDDLIKAQEKVGVVQIILYRPFPAQEFIAALPPTVRKIAVLNCVKEPASLGEPLYQDVLTVLSVAFSEKPNQNYQLFAQGMPTVICGRYGLASKDFSPAMAKGVFTELTKASPKAHFTVGINDDVSFSSIDYDQHAAVINASIFSSIFFGLGSDGTVSANKNTIKIIGEGTDLFVQAYFVYDSKKSGSRTVSYLRFGAEPISAPYLIQRADFIACHQFNFIWKLDILQKIKEGGVFLLNSPYGVGEVWEKLPKPIQQIIIERKIKFYLIDAFAVADKVGMGNRINTIMQTCFFKISGVIPEAEAINKIKSFLAKSYQHKGRDVIQKNYEAVDQALAHLYEVKVPGSISSDARDLPPIVSSRAPEFVQKVTAVMLVNKADDLPVSVFPNDGTYPSGTTKWEKRNISSYASEWNPELCIQCGSCGLICPHSVIRAKHFSSSALVGAPDSFKSIKYKGKNYPEDQMRLQVYLEDCTSCGLCQKVCPVKSKDDPKVKAIMVSEKSKRFEAEKANVEFFDRLPVNERADLDFGVTRDIQYLEPLFEFSGACAGCGETPYIKLVSQLFGDRMVVANATGCTSIYGGNLPTTPWTFNAAGRGPAWSNSLFEDNAEFGLGFRVAEEIFKDQAFNLLDKFSSVLGDELISGLKKGANLSGEKEIIEQRQRIAELKEKLDKLLKKVKAPRDGGSVDYPAKASGAGIQDAAAAILSARRLILLSEHLVPRSVWIIGGDGWAYDIGYGGLDHVLASGHKVNVMVLDTEIYSNTGGQASKSTPLGAVAKFAAGGKVRPRKDLGALACVYGNIYVAQIAIGANPAQAIRAIREAEAYDGPSLIIAYSNCINHGYDMSLAVEQQKLAVDSGFWPLYRYNPDLIKQNLNPYHLDSKPPTIKVSEYAYREPRFKFLFETNEERAKLLMQELQDDVDRKWKALVDKAQ